MSLDFSNEQKIDKDYNNQYDWLLKIKKIYKLFLLDEIAETKDQNAKSNVNKFWKNEMMMPPLLECYEKNIGPEIVIEI